jgi:hypothetical protein
MNMWHPLGSPDCYKPHVALRTTTPASVLAREGRRNIEMGQVRSLSSFLLQS